MHRQVMAAIGAIVVLLSLAVPQALIAQEQQTPTVPPEPAPVAGEPGAPPESTPGADDVSTPPAAPAVEQPPTVPARSDADTGGPVAVAAGAVSVTMADFSFTPATISIAVGDTVTWVNNGPDEPHTATAANGSFDTGEVAVGGSASQTFDQPGSFPYVCSLHPDNMKGTVQVVGASGSDPPESGDQSTDPTGPDSEAAAGEADDSGSGLPATGLPLGILLACALALLVAGGLTRRGR